MMIVRAKIIDKKSIIQLAYCVHTFSGLCICKETLRGFKYEIYRSTKSIMLHVLYPSPTLLLLKHKMATSAPESSMRKTGFSSVYFTQAPPTKGKASPSPRKDKFRPSNSSKKKNKKLTAIQLWTTIELCFVFYEAQCCTWEGILFYFKIMPIIRTLKIINR